jgi:hypothetical protein
MEQRKTQCKEAPVYLWAGQRDFFCLPPRVERITRNAEKRVRSEENDFF